MCTDRKRGENWEGRVRGRGESERKGRERERGERGREGGMRED